MQLLGYAWVILMQASYPVVVYGYVAIAIAM